MILRAPLNQRLFNQQTCSNINTCHCEYGWTGADCSTKSMSATGSPPDQRRDYAPTKKIPPPPADTRSVDEMMKNTTKLTDYGKLSARRPQTAHVAHECDSYEFACNAFGGMRVSRGSPAGTKTRKCSQQIRI